MKKGKKTPQREPILSAVARRLGHAAGRVAKVTQEMTGSLSSTADAVANSGSTSTSKQKSNTPRRRASAATVAAKRKPTKKRASRRAAGRGETS